MKEPTTDTSPGDSYVDSIAEAQAKERGIVAALADDPYTEPLRPPMVALLNSTEDARRVIWRAADKFAAKMAASQGLVQASGDAAAGAMPRQGWGAPSDLEAARSGARRDVKRQAETLVGAEIAARFAEAGATCAETFHASFVTLADAFEQAYSDWSGPAALRSGQGKLSLDDLHRQVGVEGELRAARSPMGEAIAMWASIAKSGDAAKIDLFIRAARSIALETTQSPPARLAVRLNGRDQVDDERALAFRLLDLFAKFRVTSRPPSLDAAGDLLGWMRQHSMILFGVMPTYQVPAEYLIRGIPINSRQVDAAKLPWQLQAGWLGRYIGHGAMALPGWSPIVSKTSGGAFVRQPAGG
jgi:hypothetical protein